MPCIHAMLTQLVPSGDSSPWRIQEKVYDENVVAELKEKQRLHQDAPPPAPLLIRLEVIPSEFIQLARFIKERQIGSDIEIRLHGLDQVKMVNEPSIYKELNFPHTEGDFSLHVYHHIKPI
jgi:hypothetical protein